MSKTPGIGSSREDHPTSEYTFPTGSSASPYGTLVQETVLNPEGRRLAGVGSSSSYISGQTGGENSAIDSQLWKRLFPVEADPSGVADFDAPAGCELGHFAIEERIGSGGMGAVFRALDQRLQRVVALKVLSPGQSRDRASVLRFQNEAMSAARLDHENVARVHYVGEDRGLHFIAFEYVTGQNVRDLISRTGRLSVTDAVNFTLQIAAALRHTAAAGVVHRDIKPSNIIIAPNGRAKLVDLGLARKLTPDGAGDLTVAGTTLGTFDYISPEQARDPRNVDVRSDIYSLGCTLYHMLTGGPPYSRGTVLQKLLDHQSGQAPDPRTINPQVPPALSALCRKMMAGDPRSRPATPDELIRELAVIAAGLGLRPMPAEGYIWARPVNVATPRMRSGVIWAGSAAIVLLLALIVDRPIGNDVPLDEPPVTQGGDVVAAASNGESGEDSRPSDLVEVPRRNVPTPPPLQSEPEVTSDRVPLITSDATPSQRPSGVASSSTAVPSANLDTSVAQNAEATSGSTLSGRLPMPAQGSIEIASEARPKTSASQASVNEAASLAPFLSNTLDWLVTSADALNRATPVEASDSPVDPLPYGTATLPFVLRPLNNSAELGEYRTLADAIAYAESGDTIELHFDGRGPGLTSNEPFTVDGRQLTIKAGYNDQEQRRYRPRLEFVADPSLTRQSQMMRVTGQRGGLNLQGVELTMTVKGEAQSFSHQWSLFSLFETQQVRLKDVGITVINPKAWPGVSVFDLRPPEDISAQNSEFARLMNEDRAAGFAVELDGCMVRGGTDFMTIAHTRPGRLLLRDSAFALQSALLNVTGGIELPLAGEVLAVDISHITVVAGDAVLRLDVGSLPNYATPIHTTVRDSVFATSSAGPMVLMKTGTTAPSPTAFLEMLEWHGNNNVFDGFSEYWSVLTEDGASDLAPARFPLWQDHWQQYSPDFGSSVDERAISPSEVSTIWAKAWEAKKTNKIEVQADDLELDPRSSRIELAATDGPERAANVRSQLIGAAIDELPRFIEVSIGVSAASSSGSALESRQR